MPSKKPKLIQILLISLILSLAFFIGVNIFQRKLEDFFTAQLSEPFEKIILVKVPPRKPKLNLRAKSALSLKINKFGREKILFQKNANQILPIASLTKLMTALIIFEDPEDYEFSKIIKISKKAANQENVPEYGNLKEGERKTVRELLNLMLYWSSNDAAFALAEVKGGEFIKLMNQKAKSLGLKNTHFVNPTGLDPEDLYWDLENKDYFTYSTAKDLTKLAKYILNELPLIFEFTNRKDEFNLLENQKIVGMKTGYTNEAGGCIILIFGDERENYFINTILGTETKEARFEEMQKLINRINQ